MMKSGLVIREPWISKILAREKTWEMRSTAVRKRERIALIRKGGGLVVGTAWLIDSRPPLTRENYMDYCDKHAIPVGMLDEVIRNKWVHPWVLADARRLPRLVPYRHGGGVTFVTLEQSVLDAIAAQEVETNAAENSRSLTPEGAALVDCSPRGAEPLSKPPVITPCTSVMGELVFEFRPEKAQAYGRPLDGKEFLVLKELDGNASRLSQRKARRGRPRQAASARRTCSGCRPGPASIREGSRFL